MRLPAHVCDERINSTTIVKQVRNHLVQLGLYIHQMTSGEALILKKACG